MTIIYNLNIKHNGTKLIYIHQLVIVIIKSQFLNMIKAQTGFKTKKEERLCKVHSLKNFNTCRISQVRTIPYKRMVKIGVTRGEMVPRRIHKSEILVNENRR